MREMKKAVEDEKVLVESAKGNLPCECDERHYIRFLRKVLPGPERTKGEYACDTCGEYFSESEAHINE